MFPTAAIVSLSCLLCTNGLRVTRRSQSKALDGAFASSNATLRVPTDCGGVGEQWLVNGHVDSPMETYPDANGACRGLCSCYDKAKKMPKYVKYELLKSAKRSGCRGIADSERGLKCYDRSHLSFKVDPGLCTGCREKGNIHICTDCSDQASPEAEAFGGTLCPSCGSVRGKFQCDVAGEPSNIVGSYCAYYSMFEGRKCSGWEDHAQYSDYDLGHLAASVDTYDQEQVEHQCMRRTATSAGGGRVHEGDSAGRYSDYPTCKWHSSYMMTNIVPQAALFNRGCWRDLEEAIKEYAYVEDLDVVAGTDTQSGRWTLRTGAESWSRMRKGSNVAGFPHYMYKVACQKTSNPKCVGWYMENRNFYMAPGCRTPLTLDQLAAKMGRSHVPGFGSTRSSSLLTSFLDQFYCADSTSGSCGSKDRLYTNANESEVSVSDGTCNMGASCEADCQCCGATPQQS